MIVVVGRPVAVASARAGETPVFAAGGRAAGIARAAVRAGAAAEVVGSVGDDAEGDAVVVDLGRTGVGHAALLRDPATSTPVEGRPSARLPRLEAADLELGLGYLVSFSVLVLTEPLPPDVEAAALAGAAFRDAAVIAIVPDDAAVSPDLAAVATVLGMPDDESPAFAAMVGRFAAELERGTSPDDALSTAVAAVGWEATG